MRLYLNIVQVFSSSRGDPSEGRTNCRELCSYDAISSFHFATWKKEKMNCNWKDD